MTPFPWDEAMRFGFGVLRLSPQAFWSMTPRELSQAIRAMQRDVPEPIGRDAFADLMKRYPDRNEHSNGR